VPKRVKIPAENDAAMTISFAPRWRRALCRPVRAAMNFADMSGKPFNMIGR
jgi:hypothetical protein